MRSILELIKNSNYVIDVASVKDALFQFKDTNDYLNDVIAPLLFITVASDHIDLVNSLYH